MRPTVDGYYWYEADGLKAQIVELEFELSGQGWVYHFEGKGVATDLSQWPGEFAGPLDPAAEGRERALRALREEGELMLGDWANVKARDRFRAALAALVEVHLNTRDCEPMQPETAAALGRMFKAVHEQHSKPPAPEAPIHYAPYGKNKLGQFDCGASDGGWTGQPASVTCEGCKRKSPGLWAAPEAKATEDLAWNEWADRKEKETVWRRDRSGTPGNRAIDEACFREGFRLGSAALGTEQTMHAAWRKRAEEAERDLALLRTAPAPEADAAGEAWTKESPKVPGWYWWRQNEQGKPGMILLEGDDWPMPAWVVGSGRPTPATSYNGGQWQGPLTPRE